MFWAPDSLSWTQWLGLKVLKCGRMPRHVGVIMDGNRRFARSRNEEVHKGHLQGCNKLLQCAQWLLELGVEAVTVYAFSIENFKRTKQEVDFLMDLLREKLKKLIEDIKNVNEKGLRFKAIGNLSLLPADIVSLIAEAEQISKDNNKILLNLAVAYTSQEEVTNAVNIMLCRLKNGDIIESDVNNILIQKCLYTGNSPRLDLIFRTSGEMRLSDFLLYQGSCSYLHFTKSTWPELSAWDILWAVFKYQLVFDKLEEARSLSANEHNVTFNSNNFVKSIS